MHRLSPCLALLAAVLVVGCSQAPAPVVEPGSAAAGVPVTVEPLEAPIAPEGPILRYVIDPSKIVPVPPTPGDKVERRAGRYSEMPISEEEFENQRAAAAFLEPDSDIQILEVAGEGGASGPPQNVGFETLNFGDDPTGVPPDPEMAAGLDHLVVVVNTSIEAHTKDGTTVLGPMTLGSFFSGVSGCSGLFDPNVLYDDKEDRFFVGVDSGGTGYCFAVSQTGDPTGLWNAYRFSTTPGLFFDFPHAGIGEEAIFMGANMFSGGFVQSEMWAIDKAAAYAGVSPLPTPVNQVIGGDTPQPMHAQGFPQGTWPAGNTHYIMNDDAFDGTSYGVWSWTDPFGANLLVRVGAVDLNTFTGVTAGQTLNFPQMGSAAVLQGNDFRCQDAEWRNGSIWMAHSMSCNPGGGSVNCVRWAEINPLTATVIQAGVVASDGEYRQFPNVAVNDRGDMILGYTKGSATMFPSVYVTGRLGTDPLNTLMPEVEVKAGEIVYTGFDGSPHRWGDYSEACHDPDGTTLWYVGEYSEDTGLGTRWGNYVASFFGGLFADGFESGDTSSWSSQNP